MLAYCKRFAVNVIAFPKDNSRDVYVIFDITSESWIAFLSTLSLRRATVCCEEDGSAHCGSRPYDPENPNARCSAQSKKPEGIAAELADVIIRVLDYCAYAGIDIENVLEVKHEYNKSRPYRHGGKKC